MPGRRPPPATEEKLRFLADPAHHTGGIRRVEVRETHFAWLFFTDREVFKLKKPVRGPGFDYRAPRARRLGCERELRLNRRLAPTVYLSVTALGVDREGHMSLQGRGRAVDYLVRMRRLDDARMLDRVAARRGLRAAEIRRLAALLVRFYAAAPRRPMRAEAYRARLRRGVRADLRILERTLPAADARRVRSTGRTALEALRACAGALGLRAGRLRDTHGDLRAEHVYTGEPACVIDCLEFDRELRRLDPVADLANLLMEIERLNDAAGAGRLLAVYRRRSGDAVCDTLVQLYAGRAALLRARLAAQHLADPTLAPRGWLLRSRRLLAEAQRRFEAVARLTGSRPPVRAAAITVPGRAAAPAARDARSAQRPRRARSPRAAP